MERIDLNTGKAHDAEPSGGRTQDYVVVDDLGDFTYYPSEATMLEDMEYVDEAASILDRAGNDFRLTLEKDRKLRLGSSFGRVEFTWLRQAWMTDRRRDPRAHRLLRLYPTTLDALLAGIFETLTLELAIQAANSTWVLDVGGEETHPATLKDIDGLLAGLDHLEMATVRDPFGHGYRPIRHATHRFHTPGAGAIYYVEIEPHPEEAGHRPDVSDSLP
ncbi:hypothetical protein [Arthrobacter sp. MMS18-M83]|uniref:hypothetical protein n=1 Tax=Arthrobacter sp. MMS18-M83 TaxID=2996261 RepID=UPI00227B2CBF|nr:hypothetical protein [Arthrobacter sp. MMS18-M83]WAH95254.1 hypothetical protein OW521_12340 [Arthrobacter sp. MMS18-M83]